MANEIQILLIAEDDVNTQQPVADGLGVSWRDCGGTCVRALELIGSFNPHILLSDLKMPRKGGLEKLLHDIREMGINLPTMISGQGGIPDVVKTIKLGA